MYMYKIVKEVHSLVLLYNMYVTVDEKNGQVWQLFNYIAIL